MPLLTNNIDDLSGNMGVQIVSHPLFLYGSSMCGKFMHSTSSHSKLEDYVGGHSFGLSSFYLWNNLFAKNVAILHPHKRRH